MKTFAALALVVSATFFGPFGCSEATESIPAPPPSETPSSEAPSTEAPSAETPSPAVTPEQPIITGFGVDSEGRLYQNLLLSKKVHDEAVNGAPYRLALVWSCPLVTKSERNVAVVDLEVTPYRNGDYVATTVRTTAQVKEVEGVTALIMSAGAM